MVCVRVAETDIGCAYCPNLCIRGGGGMINNTKKKVLIAAAYSKGSPPHPYIEGGLGRTEKRANQG